ncbi:MAG: MFS transporter [Solirubrobacteraceae bacterium]|nr:MFS transporter [Solirubrobacteraceae bacterium]
MTASDTAAAPRWTAREWGALLVLCGALFLDGLDVSMVGVALPSIEADLGLSTTSLQWIVSGYVLGFGGLVLLGGRAADLLGRRKVFLTAVAVFTVASLIGGLVDDGTALIATRFIKGVAAAFTAPAALSIITTRFAEGPERNRALAIYTATGASGFSLGLVFGGLLTEVSWRLTFLMPVPFALLILLTAPRLIAKDEPAHHVDRRGFDLLGAVTIAATTLGFAFTIVSAPEVGWGSARTLMSLVGVALLLFAFVRIEQRAADPLVRLGILKSPPLVRANITIAALFGSWCGFQFIGTLYMQQLLGWSPMEMALAFLPAGLIVALGSTRVGPLVDRFGTTRMITAGITSMVVAYILFLGIDTDTPYLTGMLPTMLFAGAGFALAFGPLNMAGTNGIADEEQGLASGLITSSLQLGGAFGLAVTTAVISAGVDASDATGAAAELDGYALGLFAAITIAAIGAVTMTTALVRRPSAHPATK